MVMDFHGTNDMAKIKNQYGEFETTKKPGAPTKRQIINKKISESLSKLTPEAIQKLEQVYSLDASVGEICCYLDISDQTLTNWRKKNPELFGKLQRLRDKPVLKARQTVISKANDSYANAMDYLSRKRKGEFSTKHEIEQTVYDGGTLSERSKELLKELYDDPRKNREVSRTGKESPRGGAEEVDQGTTPPKT